LNRSLSVLLPIRTVQNTPAAQINEALELLPELTDRFELLITDDGSAESSWEIAHELVRQYPQVRLLRQPTHSAEKSGIRSGADAARGDIVIAHDGSGRLDARAIDRIWRSTINGRTLERHSGFRLLWPAAIEELRRPAAIANDIGRKELLRGPNSKSAGSTTVDAGNGQARRPNFLSRVGSRVRDFATGE
jgi:glycosyltransferase involved in cell wall biosynthesis